MIWTEAAGARDDVFFTESSIYYERPVAERVSIVAAPWVTTDANSQELDDLRWEVTLAGKAGVLRTERTVMAVQAGVVWRSDPDSRCPEPAAELRWLGGATFGRAGRGFANLEVAGRASEAACTSARADLTLGYRPRENWLALGQVFTDEAELGDTAVKAQISLVRFGQNGRGIQLGLRARIDGESAEPALVLGFWRGGG